MFNMLQAAKTHGFTLTPWDQKETPEFTAATVFYRKKYYVFINYDNIETNAEAKTIEAHEAGHCISGTTHKLHSPFELIEKNEYKADYAAAKLVVAPDELKARLQRGEELWEIAENIGITIPFLQRIIYIYKCKQLI